MQENFRYIVGGKEVTRDEFFNIAGDWVTTVSGWDVSKQPFSNYFDGEKNKTAGLSTRHKAGKTMTYLDEAIEQEENLKIVGDLEGINKPPQAKVSPHFLDEVLEQTNSAEKETKTKNFPEYTTTTITLETNPEQREKINEIIEEFNKNSAKENKTEENLVFPKDSEIHKEELPPYEPLDFSLLLTDWVDTLTGKFDRPNSFSIRPEGVKETEGVKLNKNKPQMSLLFKQFPKALEAIVRCSEYGHNKYKETDKDYLNFKRVEGGSKAYADAGLRHRMQQGIDLESGLPHAYHSAWNALSELELWIDENNPK
jgi:hypothetical protein